MVRKKNYNVNNDIVLKENVDIEEALDETGHGRYNLYVLIVSSILNIGGTMDVLCLNVIVPAASCDLDLTLVQTGLLTSITFAGFVMAIPLGYLTDRTGRKKVIVVSATIGFMVSVITSFSTNFYMMLVLKFIGSIFSAACVILSFIYVGENTCLKYRTRYQFMLNVAPYAADFVCFLLAFLILPLDFRLPFPFLMTYKPWRLLTLVIAIPTGLAALLMCFLEESPKILAANGNTDEAINVLKKISKINNGVDYIYPVNSLIRTKGTYKNVSFWNSVIKQTVPIFQPPLLWRTLQLFTLLSICCAIGNVLYVWFPAMANSFFTSENDDLNFCQKIIANITPVRYDEICKENMSLDTFYSGMVLTLIFTVLNAIVIVFANSRRILIGSTCFISGIACIAINFVYSVAGIIMLYLTILLVGVNIGGIISYYVDIFPTSHRGLATSLGTMISRLSCLVGVNLIGILVIDYCSITFYGTAVSAFCGCILAIFLPGNFKTRNQQTNGLP